MRHAVTTVIVLMTLSVFSFPTFLNGIVPPANAASTSFSFSASGDMGSLTATSSVNSLNRLVTANPNFFLGLGDFSYDPSVTGGTWCGQFKSKFANIQILPGDHDTGGHNSISFGETHSYERYVNGCPPSLGVPIVCGPVVGSCYGKEYYFDYPATNPIARFIFASPKIYNITGVCTSSPNCSSQTGQSCTDQYGCWQYQSGDIHYNWVSSVIDGARSAGIRWVIVATHKLCISASDATCSMGIGFFNLLVQKKVDLVIQAHDNAYERSKQIAFNPATGCSSIKTDGNGYAVYNSGCVVDSGSRGYYTPGAGSVVVVQGAWVNDLYGVNASSSNPENIAEAPYFAKLMGGNTLGNGLGFTKYTVSAGRIDVQTNFSGAYSDSFSIWGGTTPLPTASWSPLSPQVGQSVTFTASATGGAPPYSFSWDFGDGGKATGTTATHVYASANYFNVTLSTVDSANNTGSSRSIIAVGSWNPNVACVPSLTNLSTILGTAYPSQSLAGSQWQTNSTAGGIPNKRALSPPCTLTNINVRAIPSLVEVDNVYLTSSYKYDTADCTTRYDPVNGGGSYGGSTICDSTGNVFSIGTTSGFLHIEFDQDWMAKGYCGPASTICNNSTIAQYTSNGAVSLDVQGFVYWDPEAPNAHWEIHPITAWRQHQSNPRTTSTTVVCTSPVVVNQASNCTATIADSSSGGSVVTPTGNVSFVSDSLGTFSATSCTIAAVSTGVAGCSVSYKPGATGNHRITGSYLGDAVHSASNGVSTITIGKRQTSADISCSPTGLGVNQVCTATVADNAPGTLVTPVGDVSFTTNSTGTFSSNSCTLSGTGTSGVASCQVTYTPIAVATHTVTGTYSGDAIHLTSQGSASIGFGKDSTTTTVACSPASVVISQVTTCTVTVDATTPISPTTPTGTVSFASNGAGAFAGAPCTLVSQTATSSSCQVTYTPTGGAGTHSIAATYNSDATHNGSTQAFSLTVTLRTTSTSVSCSPSGVVVNQATSCTAVVADSSGSGGTTPTGNVVFTPGGSCTLVSGTCSVSITPSSSGSLSISASYGGDSSHSTSSGSSSVAVGNRSTSTSVSCSPSPVTNNTATSCVATVIDSDVGSVIAPGGSVGFASNSIGVFSQSSCILAASGTAGIASCSVNYTPGVTGFHAITASYAGDSSHLGSGGSTTLTVVGAAPQPAYALVISNDGKVSRLYQNGTLTLVGQPVTTALRSVAWKPDGSYALISGDSAVLLKYDGTALTTIPTGISTGFNFWTVSWKPDGSYALVGGSSGLLFKYNGVTVTTIPNTSTTILSINWQPSGSYALLVGKSGLALTYDGTTVRSFATGTTFDLDAAAWNPNGAYALIGGLSRTLLRFNGTGIVAINTSIVPPSNAIRAISFNQAGTMALLAGDNGMVLTWNGSTLTMLPTLTSSWLYSISWSPSGTAYIAGGSGTVLTYTNGTLAKLATSPVTTTQYRGIAWKPQ